jgi:hypothetical protein
MNSFKTSIVIGLLFIVIFSGCSNKTATETQVIASPSALPLDKATSSYPGPQETAPYPLPQDGYSDYSPYPYPMSTSQGNVTVLPTFTTDPSMSNVTGRLLENDSGVGNITLYLAEVLKDKTNRDIVAGLDRANSPSAVTTSDGSFTFVNVPPGRYALILDVITNQYLMSYPGEETQIIIQVESGSKFDLGDLNYDSLPIK